MNFLNLSFETQFIIRAEVLKILINFLKCPKRVEASIPFLIFHGLMIPFLRFPVIRRVIDESNKSFSTVFRFHHDNFVPFGFVISFPGLFSSFGVVDFIIIDFVESFLKFVGLFKFDCLLLGTLLLKRALKGLNCRVSYTVITLIRRVFFFLLFIFHFLKILCGVHHYLLHHLTPFHPRLQCVIVKLRQFLRSHFQRNSRLHRNFATDILKGYNF